MTLHLYLNENESEKDLTNFDFAKAIYELFDNPNFNYGIDIETIVKMILLEIN